ncbi:MAG: hypothetical protein ACI9U2_002101, partial [Bradymonadia bacterium]
VEEGTHTVPIEHPTEVNFAVIDFLSRCGISAMADGAPQLVELRLVEPQIGEAQLGEAHLEGQDLAEQDLAGQGESPSIGA